MSTIGTTLAGAGAGAGDLILGFGEVVLDYSNP